MAKNSKVSLTCSYKRRCRYQDLKPRIERKRTAVAALLFLCALDLLQPKCLVSTQIKCRTSPYIIFYSLLIGSSPARNYCHHNSTEEAAAYKYQPVYHKNSPFILYKYYNIYFIKNQLRRTFVNHMNCSARFLKISTNPSFCVRGLVFNSGY